MRFPGKRITSALLAVIGLVSSVFLLFVLWEDAAFSPTLQKLSPIRFEGVYQTSPEKSPQPLEEDLFLSAAEYQTLILTGHFTTPISAGQNLLLRLQNLRVRIWQNGDLIFSFGQPGSYPSFSKSPGNVWKNFSTPAISPEDSIKIELESVYPNNVSTAYLDFLSQLQTGDTAALLHQLFQETGPTVLLGGMVFLLGCLLLITTAVLRLMKTRIPIKALFFSLLAISSGLWFFFDFRIISLIIPFGVFGNILSMLCLCLFFPLLNLYALQFVKGRGEIALTCVTALQLCFTLFYLVTQGLSIYDGFDLLTPLVLLIVMGLLCLLAVLFYETVWKKNHEARFMLLSSAVLLLIFADAGEYLVERSPSYLMTKIAYCLFIAIHFFYVVSGIHGSILSLQRAKRLEGELAQSRIAIALSQIQPHFLYNTLTAIKQLCAVDPQRAEQAIGNFSIFLRGNLDSLTSTSPIPFERELNHIRHYLALEQLRFGKRLQVVFDLQFTGFLLPSLTVQPLVENAVRYGVTKKAQGGTVTISTREEASHILLQVSDDGAGFNPERPLSDNRSHIGIENVQNRLKAQCDGLLTVKSAPGSGTVVTILLKKE